MREKCKARIASVPRDAFVIVVLVLASSASFGLGYLAGVDASEGGGGIEMRVEEINSPALEATTDEVGKFMASKNGTKYYLPACAGADRISDANKVWFPSKIEAQRAGYTPAANCPGL